MIKRLITCMLIGAAAIAASAFRTEKMAVPSQYLQKPDSVVVIVPERTASRHSFPTVYLLHGHSNDQNGWLRIRPDLGKIADDYGFIFVMPNGYASWYWDSPLASGIKMESFITKELVPFIDSRFPTIPKASHRAITGLSMGGHGGLWLGTRHPELFGSMGSTSGGVNILPFPKSWNMADQLGPYEQNKLRWKEHTVASLVPQMKANGQNIIFDCGTEDFFFRVNEDLHRALLEAGVKHDYITRPGAHNNKYWANSLLYQLVFFNEAFKANDQK